MTLPPAIIFVNNDISDVSLSKIESQLFIAEVMDGYEFADRIIADPNYPFIIHMNKMRIIVKQDMTNETIDQNIADVVMFVKYGMASILKNNCGSPGLTLPLNNLEIHQLLRYNNSIYTLNLVQPAVYPCTCCNCCCSCCTNGLGGIFAIEARDISGVHCNNIDNECHNVAFINRR